ncbi:MAG: hypothetical protein J6C40_13790, partial [Lentisphaeria bacterium]|nr:hypothetical protein [Lentisphaeria bacterium]
SVRRPNVGLGSGRLSPRAGLSSLRGIERTKHSEAPVKISQPFVQSLSEFVFSSDGTAQKGRISTETKICASSPFRLSALIVL